VTTKMRRQHSESLLLVVLGVVAFLALGAAFFHSYDAHMNDFRALYYPTRCLLGHGDPYLPSDVERVYREHGGEKTDSMAENNPFAALEVYPPTVFPYVLPFALLPWRTAELAWLTINIGAFLLACFLLWHEAAEFAPDMAGLLLFLLLINGESLIVSGNVAAAAIGLSAVSVWCFWKDRFVVAGLLCLAAALALKPQDAGQVWLCLLLCGGVYRKRALQSLLVLLAVALPSLLWVWQASPHWMAEMRANIQAFSLPGGINDPGPSSRGGGIDGVISLQTVFSILHNNPRFYNLASYLACTPPLILWAVLCLRSRPSAEKLWIALAVIAPLSMLPVYHRQLDTAILLLCVPAAAMLWAKRDSIAKLTLLICVAGFLMNGFLPRVLLFTLIKHSHWRAGAQIAMQSFPIPGILLAMSLFFLWVFWKRFYRSAELPARATESNTLTV